MSMAYHPQTDGQSERIIQTLEDMLRACVIDFGGSWDVHLPLAELSYNNSYHSSIRCASFEALYGRKCRSPVLWAKIGESRLIGPELVQETTDKVVLIKEKLKAKGMMHFGKKGKLTPRFLKNRPYMLERGSYIPWASRFRRYLNRKRDNRKWLLKALDEGPYEFKNFLPEGSTIPRLQTIEDLEGDDLLLYDAEMESMI
ncbi:putative reverse transcriptase domain-containing protein [Tanacetum coccineum]